MQAPKIGEPWQCLRHKAIHQAQHEEGHCQMVEALRMLQENQGHQPISPLKNLHREHQ